MTNIIQTNSNPNTVMSNKDWPNTDAFLAHCTETLSIGGEMSVPQIFLPKVGVLEEDWSFLEEIQMSVRVLQYPREKFGLPVNECLILTSSDQNGWMIRKIKLD
jgi:hypothetical protein